MPDVKAHVSGGLGGEEDARSSPSELYNASEQVSELLERQAELYSPEKAQGERTMPDGSADAYRALRRNEDAMDMSKKLRQVLERMEKR